jgi:hypothetical protein
MTRVESEKAAGTGGGASGGGGGGAGSLQLARPAAQKVRPAIKAMRMGAIDVICPAVLAPKAAPYGCG